MINYSSEIKLRVSMMDICNHYGIEVNRSGFAKCVFHPGDNTASMKIYPGSKGFYCFGCGEAGDVIGFVRKYFNLTFPQAIAKLNSDMGLGLPINSNANDERKRYSANTAAWKASWKRKQAVEAYQKRLENAQTDYNNALDEFVRLDLQRLRNDPMSLKYEEAVKQLPTAQFKLDTAEMELVKIEQEERR